MTTHNIIFQPWGVRAILLGAKTQTRRILKDGAVPKYAVGDRLRVREAWRVGAWDDDTGRVAVDYRADNFARREWITIDDPEVFEKLWVESSEDAMRAGVLLDADGKYHWLPGHAPTRWRSAMLMYNWAARLYLTVTNVRVEKIQDISEADALAEGALKLRGGMLLETSKNASPVEYIAAAWNVINGKPKWRKGRFEAYPWSWDYFRVTNARGLCKSNAASDIYEGNPGLLWHEEPLRVYPNPLVAAYTFKISIEGE